MKNIAKTRSLLDFAVSLALIVACCAVTVQVGWYFKHLHTESKPRIPTIGEKVLITGQNWPASQVTVLLALSTTCHFCEESYPFYRDLSRAAAVRHIQVIAQFPQGRNEALEHLKAKNVQGVMIGSFEGPDITGTPTIFLVDERGFVRKQWIGLLTDSQKQDVLSSL